MKACTACKIEKSISDFCKKKSSKDGLNEACRSCMSERNRKWREANPEKVREFEKKAAEYRKKYKQQPHRKERTRELQSTPESKAARAKRVRERRAKDHVFRIKSRISCLVNASLRSRGIGKRGRSWETLLGYTRLELMEHLEAQFVKGMSWDNVGDWHIDHIVPISTFRFDGPDDPEFKAAWALTNLRPLWAEANKKKGDKRIYLL